MKTNEKIEKLYELEQLVMSNSDDVERIESLRFCVTGGMYKPRKTEKAREGMELNEENYKLLRGECTRDEMARVFGIGKTTLYRWREKNGFVESEKIHLSVRQFDEMRTSGQTYAQIAQKTGMTDGTLRTWRRKNNR